MPYNVGKIFDGAAVLLNDSAKTSYTDTVMLPFLVMAYQELRQELEAHNIPCSNRTSAAFTINAGVKDIGGSTGPALPTDFIDPLDLHERTLSTNDDYLLMDRVDFLPMTEITTSFLRLWSYQGFEIKFLGANSDLNVKMNYVGDPLRDIIDENTQIRVINSENCLKYRTASLCAEFIGENPTRAQSLNGMAQNSLDTLMSVPLKGQQSIATRRRPFRARAKSNGYGSSGW